MGYCSIKMPHDYVLWFILFDDTTFSISFMCMLYNICTIICSSVTVSHSSRFSEVVSGSCLIQTDDSCASFRLIRQWFQVIHH